MSSEEKEGKKKKRIKESFADMPFERDEHGYGGRNFGGSDESFSQSIEEMSDEAKSRPPPDHLGRVNKGPMPDGLQAPRTKSELDQIKGKCDCIILRLDRLPIDPTTLKEVDGQNFYKSVFDQRRDFSAVMSGWSAYDYMQQRQDKTDREKSLLSTVDRHLIEKPEWLHSIADCLGGPVAFWNGAAGSHAANTQMLAIESAIKAMPGIGVEVSAYTKSGSRVAEFYEYKVFVNGDANQAITFIIDAQRQWYNQDDWNKDVEKITEFLESVEDLRSKRHCQLEFPEIIHIDLAEGGRDLLLSEYLEPGPVFVKFVEREDKKDKREATFTNVDSGVVIEADLLGHHRYSGYQKRMLIKYPFHYEQVMSAIRDPTNDLDAICNLYDQPKVVAHMFDCRGNFLAHYAAQYGNPEILNDLIEVSFDLTIANHNGDMPLHLAAKAGHLLVVQTLIDFNASVIDAKNEQGNTPLHLAMKSGNVALIQLLIDKGANLHASNNRDETPLDLAKKFDLLSQLKIPEVDESVRMEIDHEGRSRISPSVDYPEQKLPVPGYDLSSSPQLGPPRRSSAPLPSFQDEQFSSSSSKWEGSKTKQFGLKRKEPDFSDDMDEVKDPRDKKIEPKEPDPKKPRLEEKKPPDSDDEMGQQSSSDEQPSRSPMK